MLAYKSSKSSFIIYYLEGQQTFPFNPRTRFPLYLATRREPFYLQLTIAEINRWSCELRYFSNFVEKGRNVSGTGVSSRETFSDEKTGNGTGDL